MHAASRRQFLGGIGQGFLFATCGVSFERSVAAIAGPRRRSRPDELDELVQQMCETAPAELLPKLVATLRGGTPLDRLVVAGALANARTFGGSDYEGYHAFMALLPALAMSRQMPAGEAALPVLKVLWRNTARIKKAGGGRTVLTPVEPGEPAAGDAGVALRDLARNRELAAAERLLARRCAEGPEAANADLQAVVQDDLNVHRTVLALRAWQTAQLAGDSHAETMLRQIVRFCIAEEKQRVDKGYAAPAVREVVPHLLERHGLLQRGLGERALDDARLEELVAIVFGDTRERAAEAVAKALAEGIAPAAVGEAISLAANRLLLHDTGERRVHGASVGVHASDAANAWCHLARAATPATAAASLVVGAFHTAGQSQQVGKEPYESAEAAAALGDADGAALLRAAVAAIEQRDQRGACAAVRRYGANGGAVEPVFDLLLRYAIDVDGALHAEKYFHTVREEFARTRESRRWHHVVALARVTASAFGEAAPGVEQARELLRA